MSDPERLFAFQLATGQLFKLVGVPGPVHRDLCGGAVDLTEIAGRDAATTAFNVGNESPSQFSREYNRQFGAPPLWDIANLRQMAAGERG
jgi:AraC-like DNA-binding protein